MPWTHEMVVIHRVFRREAALLLQFVTGTRAGDTGRAAQVADAIREYTGALHHHHHLEDELVWPLLHARARLYADLVNQMEKQHDALDGTLTTIAALLPRWEAGAAPHLRDELAAVLAGHRAVLVEHLDDEEQHVLPLVAEHLSTAEWDLVGRRGLETVPKAKVMLALGAILEEATPDERRHFLGKVPAAGRLLWWLAGRHQYDRQMGRLRDPLAR